MAKMVCIAKVIEKVGLSWFEIWGERGPLESMGTAADISGLTSMAGKVEDLPKKDIILGGTLKLKTGNDDDEALANDIFLRRTLTDDAEA